MGFLNFFKTGTYSKALVTLKDIEKRTIHFTVLVYADSTKTKQIIGNLNYMATGEKRYYIENFHSDPTVHPTVGNYLVKDGMGDFDGKDGMLMNWDGSSWRSNWELTFAFNKADNKFYYKNNENIFLVGADRFDEVTWDSYFGETVIKAAGMSDTKAVYKYLKEKVEEFANCENDD